MDKRLNKPPKNKKSQAGYMVSKKQVKIENPDYDKLHRSSGSEKEEKGFLGIFSKNENKLDCPDKSNRKSSNPDLPEYTTNTKANIIRSSSSVHFDVIELDDIHLDIPAFKLFKNNMTDFTADGEHEFEAIIKKIDHFLGKNHEGKGVTLKIIGSASQIPTSFDPDKPNNNINSDGSSILGKTSIENNKKLAKARADELAKKIIAIFPEIMIQTPAIADIELGPTRWTEKTQKALNLASLRKDKEAIQKIYEPFQKDQWVKVASKDKTTKVIQPESIKMYMVSTSPYLKMTSAEGEIVIKSVFIVSKNTYDLIGDHHTFGTVEARDNFIKKHDLRIFYEIKNGITRYYLLKGNDEIEAFHIGDYKQKIYTLYNMGIVDNLDETILEDKIIADLKELHETN